MKTTEFIKESFSRAEYDDEAGMTKNSLHTIIRVATHLEKAIAPNENMPEWVQEKIGAIKGMMVSVMDYVISQHEMSQEEMPKFNRMQAENQIEEAMSRAAKGYEKYGKKGMAALAKAGRDGKDLEPVRAEYDQYDESTKKGLYYNVNKRKAAGTSRSASSPKAPTDQAWKDAAKTAKTESTNEEWSKKYKSSINCSHPKGFSQKAHCAGKKKHTESHSVMEATCPDCGMCKTHGNLNEIAKGAKDSNGFTKCWPGKHAEGTKTGKNGGQVRNCVANESADDEENYYYRVRHQTKKDIEHEMPPKEWTSVGSKYATYEEAKAAYEELKAKHPQEKFTYTRHPRISNMGGTSSQAFPEQGVAEATPPGANNAQQLNQIATTIINTLIDDEAYVYFRSLDGFCEFVNDLFTGDQVHQEFFQLDDTDQRKIGRIVNKAIKKTFPAAEEFRKWERRVAEGEDRDNYHYTGGKMVKMTSVQKASRQGWAAGVTDQPNPYAPGSAEHKAWASGYRDRELQPRHYNESIAGSIKEDASSGATGSGSVAAVVGELGGGMSKREVNGKLGKYTNVKTKQKAVRVKGAY